jgi:hypothetical protein
VVTRQSTCHPERASKKINLDNKDASLKKLKGGASAFHIFMPTLSDVLPVYNKRTLVIEQGGKNEIS